jgi:hypothetical protein
MSARIELQFGGRSLGCFNRGELVELHSKIACVLEVEKELAIAWLSLKPMQRAREPNPGLDLELLRAGICAWNQSSREGKADRLRIAPGVHAGFAGRCHSGGSAFERGHCGNECAMDEELGRPKRGHLPGYGLAQGVDHEGARHAAREPGLQWVSKGVASG